MVIIHGMNNRHKVLGRCLAPALRRALSRAPVVVLTGARQTGKTTLARDILGHGRAYVSLDDVEMADRAEREPDTLLDSQVPLTIDEVQRSPELLLAIKRRVDRKRVAGQFLLTGSSNLALLGRVSESLAGRAVYKTLVPMTCSERAGGGACGPWDVLVESPERLRGRRVRSMDWREAALAGGLPPAALARDRETRVEWLDGYVKTYLERDLQMLSTIERLADFRRLLRITALRTGRLANQSDMARDAGLSQPTAHRYLDLLEASYLLQRLPAYAVNRTKRLIKAPRLFLSDTGLACFLAGLHAAGQIAESDMAGFILENVVLGDLLAWRETLTPAPEVLYWRTAAGKEVDFVIESEGRLTPVEVKSTKRPRLDDTDGLNAFLDEYPDAARHGLLIHTGDVIEPMSPRIWAIPLALALGVAGDNSADAASDS
jgi:predicted AAA+ superfamily ATPase